MKKLLVFISILLVSLLVSCGTVRYKIVAQNEATPKHQVEWTVIGVSFNNFYRAVLGREGGKIIE